MDAWQGAFGASGIVLASYRGPGEEGRAAAGGLASALGDLVRTVPTTWVAVGEGPARRHPGGALVRPVSLSPHVRRLFYGGFANRFYWMLAHGLWRPDGGGRVRHWFEAGYRPGNERVAQALDSALDDQPLGDGTPVWVHDYHLFLVPELLRRRRPHARIAFFLHVPWPPAGAWQAEPEAPVAELVRGMLGADVVAVQTVRDAQRLMAAAEETLPEAGVEWSPVGRDEDDGAAAVEVGRARVDGRWVRVLACPIAVDPERVAERARSPRAQGWRRLLAAPPGVRTLVRVDRLDPAKNVVRGFDAYERLLERRPEGARGLRFLAFLVPSRESLPEYRAYRRQVFERIGAINARFGRPGAAPPITAFVQNNVEAALAGLSLADAVLINSLADGMNLVAKEAAVVGERNPALVLSTRAGVAEAFRHDALLVEPEDVAATARALEAALDMPAGERERRMRSMRDKVERWTLSHWVGAQLRALAAVHPEGWAQTVPALPAAAALAPPLT